MNTKINTVSSTEAGVVLAEARKAAGYSQADLAKLLGVSQRLVSAYERGQRRINAALFLSLAKYFDISLDKITGIADENKLDGRSKTVHAIKQLEILPEDEQKLIFGMIDSLAAKHAKTE